MTDESDLLARLRAGDNQAFTELVRQHHRQLVNVAIAIVGESIAEETVQEAWVSIHRNIAKFEGRASLTTWLYSIVCNSAKSCLRKEKRHMQADLSQIDGAAISAERFDQNGGWTEPPASWDMDTPEQLLEESQLRECIEKTLVLLPDQQKAVFTLREIDQQDLKQICNNLELSDSNVRVLLHRARIRLMQVIDHYQETGTC